MMFRLLLLEEKVAGLLAEEKWVGSLDEEVTEDDEGVVEVEAALARAGTFLSISLLFLTLNSLPSCKAWCLESSSSLFLSILN